MKKLSILLILAFLIGYAASAQTIQGEKPDFRPIRSGGIKAGVNIASLTNLKDSESYLGFHAGLFGNRQVSEGFGYGGELNFSHQGVTASNLDISLNYITIPVLVNLYTGILTFQAGVYGAFLLSANVKAAYVTGDATSLFKGTDHGLLVGFNLNPAGPTFFGGRFNLGLKNVNNFQDLTVPNNTDLRNRNIQVTAGYEF